MGIYLFRMTRTWSTELMLLCHVASVNILNYTRRSGNVIQCYTMYRDYKMLRIQI